MNTYIMKYNELERKLSKEGCFLFREGGNHPLWFSPITRKTFPTSKHKSKEVRPGTLKNIERLSGVKF